MPSETRIGLIGDFNERQKAHFAIPKAIATASEGQAEATWVPTDSIGKGDSLTQFQGIWCVPGMPYRDADGVLRAIRHARISHTPFIGTSAGFQYVLIEFARNVLGLAEADHQKSNPKAAIPIISPLDAALAGVKARVRFMEGSHLRKAYRAPDSIEEYHCSFGLNRRYRRLLEGAQLYIAAVDDDHEVRAVELDGHPFFVATLFQPEMHSANGAACSPVVHAFVAACRKQRVEVTRAAS
jgi:CTP synthase (UTP-ammonia lyase)